MNKYCFLTLLLTLICLPQAKAGDCQKFEINFKNSSVNKEEFISTLSKFDIEKYRPKYLDYIMVFNNGIEVKLIAADKLKVLGCAIADKVEYPALEYLQKNISFFQYNDRQKTIMAAYKSTNPKE